MYFTFARELATVFARELANCPMIAYHCRMQEKLSLKPLKYIATVLFSFPFAAASIAWMLLMRGLVTVAAPKMMSNIVGVVASYKTGTDLFAALKPHLLLFFASTILFYSSFRFVLYFYYLKGQPRMLAKIRIENTIEILDKPIQYFHKYGTGFLTSKIEDISQGYNLFLDVLQNQLLPNVVIVFFGAISLYLIAPLLTLTLLLPFCGIILAVLALLSRLTALERTYYTKSSNAANRITNLIQNYLCVRLFGWIGEERKGLSKLWDQVVENDEKITWVYFWMFVCFDSAVICLLLTQFYLLITGVQRGKITFSDFSFTLFQSNFILSNLWQVVLAIPDALLQYVRIGSALDVISDGVKLQDKPDAVKLGPVKGLIKFDKVSFKYPSQEQALFNNFSVSIKAKEKVGLVGYSGSGKSTFTNLVLRLYDVDQGSITIDGVDIKDIQQKSLRRNIGIVPQSPMMLDRSIKENIGYGKLNSSLKEIKDAAKKAHIDDLIEAMHHGYDSLPDELSGGQKQRVAIARAILKDAPILIMDEATSQLDSVTEQEIQQSLEELWEGRTVIVIAHRLSTVSKMDRLLVFRGGQIVESGKHEDLLAMNGHYAELWNAQARGLLPDAPVS